jgi:hypothetical protein
MPVAAGDTPGQPHRQRADHPIRDLALVTAETFEAPVAQHLGLGGDHAEHFLCVGLSYTARK